MRLIEAMKKLKLIEKKMDTNCENITKYSSMLSTERPYFDSESEQRKKVQGLVQSNKDLMREYLDLKMAIERTNLATVVNIGGGEYSIFELLVIKRRMGGAMIQTYNSLNENSSLFRLSSVKNIPGEKPAHTVRYYTEDERNNGLREWHDFVAEIDSRLEVINATTELII